jgi:hypothetical protein
MTLSSAPVAPPPMTVASPSLFKDKASKVVLDNQYPRVALFLTFADSCPSYILGGTGAQTLNPFDLIRADDSILQSGSICEKKDCIGITALLLDLCTKRHGHMFSNAIKDSSDRLCRAVLYSGVRELHSEICRENG